MSLAALLRAASYDSLLNTMGDPLSGFDDFPLGELKDNSKSLLSHILSVFQLTQRKSSTINMTHAVGLLALVSSSLPAVESSNEIRTLARNHSLGETELPFVSRGEISDRKEVSLDHVADFDKYLLISPKSAETLCGSPQEIPKLIEVQFTIPKTRCIISCGYEPDCFFLTIESITEKIVKFWRTTRVFHMTNGTSWHSIMCPDNASYVRIMDHAGTGFPKWKTDILIADTPNNRIVLYFKVPDKQLNNFAEYDRLISKMPQMPADPATLVMSLGNDGLPVTFAFATV